VNFGKCFLTRCTLTLYEGTVKTASLKPSLFRLYVDQSVSQSGHVRLYCIIIAIPPARLACDYASTILSRYNIVFCRPLEVRTKCINSNSNVSKLYQVIYRYFYYYITILFIYLLFMFIPLIYLILVSIKEF